MNPVGSRAIVLVDDEQSSTELRTQLLADNLNCPVRAFARPLEALQAPPQINPAVVVTDCSIPPFNGLEFIRQATPLVPETTFMSHAHHGTQPFRRSGHHGAPSLTQRLSGESLLIGGLSPMKSFGSGPVTSSRQLTGPTRCSEQLCSTTLDSFLSDRICQTNR